MASRWVMLTPGVPYIRVVDPVGYSIKLDHQPMDLRAEGGPRSFGPPKCEIRPCPPGIVAHFAYCPALGATSTITCPPP